MTKLIRGIWAALLCAGLSPARLLACAVALLIPVFAFFNLLGWHVSGH